jgi:hypothetical protein
MDGSGIRTGAVYIRTKMVELAPCENLCTADLYRGKAVLGVPGFQVRNQPTLKHNRPSSTTVTR